MFRQEFRLRWRGVDGTESKSCEPATRLRRQMFAFHGTVRLELDEFRQNDGLLFRGFV
jgi:hypothetical protein